MHPHRARILPRARRWPGLLILMAATLLSCNRPQTIEAVVIGGGLMGSAAAWHLAEAGVEVLLLERQGEVYETGSSQGEARIARSSNRGNDIWSHLHNRSVEETRKLIDFLNDELSGSYSLDAIYDESPVTYVGRSTIFEQLYESLVRQEVDYEMATTPEEGRELFGVNLPPDVLLQREYNEHSGTLNPRQLIRWLQDAIGAQGGTVLYRQEVAPLGPEVAGPTRLQVRDLDSNNTRELLAERLVVAVGPYTGQMLVNREPAMSRLISPERVFLALFEIAPDHYESFNEEQRKRLADSYPVINSSAGTRDGSFFSMIERHNAAGHPVIKIGGHFQRSEVDDLDSVWRLGLSPDEAAWAHDNTLRYFEMIDLPLEPEQLLPVDAYSCVYSLTQSEVPYVTQLPNEAGTADRDLVVLAGMSGVGAKGAMTYGRIAADLLLEREETDEMGLRVRQAVGFDRLLSDLDALDAGATD